MTTHEQAPKKLSPKQLQAIPLLADGLTIAATAKKIGVSSRSIDTWKTQPHFQAALHKVEDEIYQESLKLLKRTTRAAIMTLVACMDPKVSNYVRVAAASKLLDQALEMGVIQETQRRLDALEEAARGWEQDEPA